MHIIKLQPSDNPNPEAQRHACKNNKPKSDSYIMLTANGLNKNQMV